MKYIFILFAGMLLLLAACKKRPADTHCYTCMRYDSIYANIPTFLVSHFEPGQDTLCNWTDDRIDYYMKTHNLIDTDFFRNDSVIIIYSSEQCEAN